MISLENIKTKIISKVNASNDIVFLEAIDRLLNSDEQETIIQLTKTQEAMLQMSEDDIQSGNLITEQELDESTKALSNSKANALNELEDAVEEMKQVKASQLKARPIKELLDEL